MSIVFYDDSPVYGGHEVMALSGIEALLETYPYRVIFFVSKSNSSLVSKLHKLCVKYKHLEIELLAWNSSKLEGLRNILQPARAKKLAVMFEKVGAKLVVAIQGNIEHSSLSLQASIQADITSLSYIPVPHSNHAMGAKLGWLRDVFAKPIFLKPSAYITISEEMKKLLRERGAVAPVKVVYNGVDTARFTSGNNEQARSDLRLPLDKVILGLVGRLEFSQKQQDLLAKAIGSDSFLRDKCYLVYAGDGPDVAHLEKLLEAESIAYSIFPWCDTAPLYRAINALVIPSKYEGLPLVMLEALSSETMVFGSDRDGMRDVLPEKYRFAVSDVKQLSQLLVKWINEDCPKPDKNLVDRVRSDMSQQQFKKLFVKQVLSNLRN